MKAASASPGRLPRYHVGMAWSVRILAAMLCGNFAAILAAAPPATRPAESAVPVEQRAGDDAVQRLMDEVLSLRVVTGQTVSTLLGQTPEAEQALRAVILAQHQQSRPRHLPSGEVEVDVWILVADLAGPLQAIAAQHLPGVGQSQVRIAESGGPLASVTGRYRPDGEPADDRPGWRHCGTHEIALAASAARIDLRGNLLNRIGGLALSRSRTVRDVFVEHPGFLAAVRRRIDTLAADRPVFEPTGLCHVTVSLTPAEVIRLLSEAADESGESIRADFAQVGSVVGDRLVMVGFGLAPRATAPASCPASTSDVNRPDWADRFMTAKASGRAPAGVGDEQTRRQLAARAARVEAARLLWMQIEALPLPHAGSIRDLLAANPTAIDSFAAIDDAIVTTSAPIYGPDGTASVTVGIRLQTVWQLVRELSAAR